ncbi:hypothetical protein TWF730_003857 [Orbilia blumenaviensis]|uniref:UBA domain-containing protein n=1 Tax=Orbilia blumenaviensis TaxID=1796055 RepID=A0AAV9U4R9_9PEZI
MDDLAGLNWTSSANPATKQSPFSTTPSLTPGNYTSFRSSPSLTPQSTTPSRPASTKPPAIGNLRDDGSRTSAPVAGGGTNGLDSFSSLVSFGAKKSGNTGNMSMLEQQKKLQEDRLRADHLKQQKLDQQFSGLDSLGSLSGGLQGRSGTSTPARIDPEEADLLAGFSADTKVNRASHFPPPSGTPPAQTPSPMPSRLTPSPQPYLSQLSNSTTLPTNDDDPFNLDSFGSNLPSQKSQTPATNDDDDILGLLGKPVSEVRRKSPSPPPKPARPSRRPENVEELHSVARTPPPGKDPRDPAIAELINMGFSVEDSKRALAQTDTGLSVQGAIEFLLNEAHGKSKSKSQGHNHRRMDEDEFASSNRRQTRDKGGNSRPGWQGQGEMQDVAAFAQEIGGNLLKTAGSLWATSKKKVTQAINDLQEDGTPNDGTPKWMRDAQREQQRGGPSKRQEPRQTDEAMMLDMGDPRKGRPSARPQRERMPMSKEEEEFAEEQRRRQQAREERERRLESEQKPAPPIDSRRARVTREATESEQVYISPARRRKPAAPAPPPKPQVAEGDLLFGGSASKSVAPRPSQTSSPPRSSNPFSQPTSQQKPQSRPAPAPVPRVNRQIPSISQIALTNSTNSRTAGTEAFKRGDYPSALTHYSSSLSPVPSSHPLYYLILTNRAIVHIKLGDSKAALEDCDAAIAGIGGSKGVGESFDIGDGTTKDLKEIWGKAITRKAEALEHLERWSDAAGVWGLALENGVGGASASSGKARCEKALAPKAPPKPRATPGKKPPPRPQPSKPVAAQVTQAVKRLKDANEAAERADAEKLALHDSVEARLLAWKGGKETNLRALIASLDTVLWDGSGWKKVGMHELVMPNKVKIAYMKGIAKVHPDKIAQDATVEQTMLAAAVFSTLNEAWDEFKKQNNL